MKNLTNVFSKLAGRGELLLKKNSPELLIFGGIAGLVCAGVLACRSTLKVEGIIDEANEKKEDMKRTLEASPDKYSQQDYQEDMLKLTYKTGLEFAKIYGPPVTLAALSVASILSGHNIMKTRNVALIAAYKAIEGGFAEYRDRVQQRFGSEVEHELRYNTFRDNENVIEITDDNEEWSVVNKEITKVNKDQLNYSVHAKFFDEANPNWSKVPEYNRLFIQSQQNYANDMLHARGHMFLNEVYDMLGIPRSSAGSVIGWVCGKDYNNYIDFGIFNGNNPAAINFINGDERSVLLDFNVDGIIYDLI